MSKNLLIQADLLFILNEGTILSFEVMPGFF